MIVRGFSSLRAFWRGEGLGSFLARALAGSGIVQLAGMAFTFLTGVQLARGLGVSGYGTYGMAMAIVAVATLPGAMGLPKLVMREVAAADARRDPAAVLGVLRWADRTSWRISMPIGLVVAAGAWVAFLRGQAVLGMAVLLGVPMIPLLPLANIRAGALRAFHKVVLSQAVTVLLRPAALSVLLFAFFIAGQRPTAPLAVALTTLIAAAVFLAGRALLKPQLPNAAPRLDDHRSWLASTIPMALSDAVQTLQWQLATIALGLLASAAEVGVLRVATSTAIMTAVPGAVMRSVVLPMFARLHAQGNHSELQRLVTHSARLQFAGVVLLSLPLLLGGGPLLGFVFGPSYAPAAPTLQILLIGQLITNGFGLNAAVLTMTGHERRVTRAVALALALNAALVVLLAPLWGSIGTAIGVVAGQLCWNIVLWNDARRLVRVQTSIVAPSRGLP